MKLDLGCGIRKKEGFTGVDCIDFPGVDIVDDVFHYLSTLPDNSVEEINAEHFVEHFDGTERVKLFNEIWRVLQVKGKCLVTAPCWSHERAYGDPTHKWPPISTWTFFYLNAAWRKDNGPHTGYTCNFEWSIVGAWDPNDQWVNFRSVEVKQVLMSRYINVTADIICTLTKLE